MQTATQFQRQHRGQTQEPYPTAERSRRIMIVTNDQIPFKGVKIVDDVKVVCTNL